MLFTSNVSVPDTESFWYGRAWRDKTCLWYGLISSSSTLTMAKPMNSTPPFGLQSYTSNNISSVLWFSVLKTTEDTLCYVDNGTLEKMYLQYEVLVPLRRRGVLLCRSLLLLERIIDFDNAIRLETSYRKQLRGKKRILCTDINFWSKWRS